MGYAEGGNFRGNRCGQGQVLRMQLALEKPFAAQPAILSDSDAVQTERYAFQPQHVLAMQNRQLHRRRMRVRSLGGRVAIGLRGAAGEHGSKNSERHGAPMRGRSADPRA